MVEVAQRAVTPQNNGTFRKTSLWVHPTVYIVQKLPNRLFFPAVADKKAYQLIHPGQKQQKDTAIDEPTHLSQLIPQIDLSQKFALPQRYQ